MKIENLPAKQLKAYEKNAKRHDIKQIDAVAESIKRFGFIQPLVVDKDNVVVIGHCRLASALKLGLETVPVVRVDNLTPDEVKALRIADNKLNESGWDIALVAEELSELGLDLVSLTGFDLDELDIKDEKYRDGVKSSLQKAYIVPPFFIWDTKQGYWLDRKREWIEYIGYSGDGRDDDLLGEGLKKLAKLGTETYKNETALTGTSIFDPVVAELAYRWFCPVKGKVLDPFAGGHVRGSVAGVLELDYTGVDLSERQIEVNNLKAKELGLAPKYVVGNSENIDSLVEDKDFDFILSCPPYFDLEKYDLGDGDISMLQSYDEFLKVYSDIIKKSVAKLKNNRFAVWVISDVRGKDGKYYGLVKDTIQAFQDAGMSLYNEIILANAIATAPLRAKKAFSMNRKVTRVHQNILCFYKGEMAEATKYFARMPEMHIVNDYVLVFYQGDIEEIRKEFDFYEIKKL